MYKPVFLFPTEAEAAVFRQLMPEAEVVIIGVGMAEAAAMTARYLSLKPTSDVVLEDVRVPKDCLVGPLHKGFSIAMRTC